ncbi:MAG TPA: outer membrane beta-barrel protein [Pyrinomonadaceae bacterium]
MNGIKARALLLVFVLFCGASFAAAQTDDNPRAEFFAGYSVLGINYEAAPPAFPQPVIVAFDGKQFLNKGVNVSGTYYLTKRFGLTADFSAHFKTNNTPLTNGNIEDKIRILNVLGGPQYKFRNSSRVTPFVRGLAGVAVTSSKLKVMSSFTGEDTSSSTDFALALGGGVDVRVNKRLDLRVFQADYNPVFLSGGNELGFGKSRADNVRFSFGVVLK